MCEVRAYVYACDPTVPLPKFLHVSDNASVFTPRVKPTSKGI